MTTEVSQTTRKPRKVPPKLGAGKSKKINLVAEEAWLTKLDNWCKQQGWPVPTRSDAIRTLVERAIDADGLKPKKPKG